MKQALANSDVKWLDLEREDSLSVLGVQVTSNFFQVARAVQENFETLFSMVGMTI